MKAETKDSILFFVLGLTVGIILAVGIGLSLYQMRKGDLKQKIARVLPHLRLPSLVLFATKDVLTLGFENADDLKTVEVEDGAEIEILSNEGTEGGHSLSVKISAGREYPGLVWEVYGRQAQNWKDREFFQMDILNQSEHPVRLLLKFKSGRNYPKESYDHEVQLKPSVMSQIKVPLKQIADDCDLSQMSYLKIYAKDPPNGFTLMIDQMSVQ